MAGEGLKIDARRSVILERLRRDGQVRISELSENLGATVVTIRNDLAALERDGYLERTYGGAVQSVNNFCNLDFSRRRQENLPQKQAIARLAADMVQDGETLMVNSGTTTYLTAVALKKHRNLNIVTNALQIAVELGSTPTFRVILLGGEINAQYAFTYGEDVGTQLLRYKADRAILSVDGVCPKVGLTTYHAQESNIDRLMMARAEKTMIVADSAKLGRESFSTVCGLNGVDCWVTDPGADPLLAGQVESCGVKVYYP